MVLIGINVLLEQKRRHWNQMVLTVQLVLLERREKLEQTVLTVRKETLDQMVLTVNWSKR
jgi:hypothetical protein